MGYVSSAMCNAVGLSRGDLLVGVMPPEDKIGADQASWVEPQVTGITTSSHKLDIVTDVNFHIKSDLTISRGAGVALGLAFSSYVLS